MYHSALPALILRSSTGFVLELPVRADIADALCASIRIAASEVEPSRLGDLCAQDLVGLLRVLGEGDPPKPPTAPQVKFGLDISRRLGIELPIGALRDRSIMGRFLTRYSNVLRAQLDVTDSTESSVGAKVAASGNQP